MNARQVWRLMNESGKAFSAVIACACIIGAMLFVVVIVVGKLCDARLYSYC